MSLLEKLESDLVKAAGGEWGIPSLDKWVSTKVIGSSVFLVCDHEKLEELLRWYPTVIRRKIESKARAVFNLGMIDATK